MNITRSIIVCALLIAGTLILWKFVTASQFVKIPLRQPSAYSRKLLGDRTIAILQGSTRVDISRVRPSPRPPGAPTSGRTILGDYEVLSEVQSQGRTFAVRLASVLFSPLTANMAASCFGPTVALRAWKGQESIIILVCFNCNNVEVYTTDSAGKFVRIGDGDGIIGFWFSRPEMVSLVKAAFPDDRQIQQLKDQFSLSQ